MSEDKKRALKKQKIYKVLSRLAFFGDQEEVDVEEDVFKDGDYVHEWGGWDKDSDELKHNFIEKMIDDGEYMCVPYSYVSKVKNFGNVENVLSNLMVSSKLYYSKDIKEVLEFAGMGHLYDDITKYNIFGIEEYHRCAF